MSLPSGNRTVSDLKVFLTGVGSAKEVLSRYAHYVHTALGCELVKVECQLANRQLKAKSGSRSTALDTPIINLRNGSLFQGKKKIRDPLFVDAPSSQENPKNKKERQGCFAVLPLLKGDKFIGWLEVHFGTRRHLWQHDERMFLEESAEICVEKIIRSDGGAERGAKEEVSALPIRRKTDTKLVDEGGLESGSWVIMDVVEDGQIAYLSTKLTQLAGYNPQQLKGQNLFEFLEQFLVEAYREDVLRSLKRVLLGKLEKCEFFAEVLSKGDRERRHFLFQAESGASGSKRMVLVISDVTAGKIYQKKLDEAKLRSMRLVEYGNLLILRTDPELNVVDVLGDTKRILGMTVEEVFQVQNIWTRIIEHEDLRNLQRALRAMRTDPKELREEIRIRNQKTGEVRWLLLNAVPLFDVENTFIGWEGFGLDISEKRRTEEELVRQRRRIEALYEVSRALQVNMDPAFVALRGLKALVRATACDAGFVVFYNRPNDFLEIVAAQGLSQEYIDSVSKVMSGKNLMRYVIDNKEGLLLDNVQKDDRAAVELAVKEQLRSTIVMPLMFEERGIGMHILGALILFSRKSGKFSVVDFDLVAAASSQVALVARQAEYYAAEKRQANSLAALYRLSHELSKLMTPREVAEHAFPVIQEELACKRMWMGVINEQGTHIEGQGGVGPGIRKSIAEIQIELGIRHDFLDEAISTKQAVIVQQGTEMNCSGLNRFLDRLKPNTFIILPLVSLGQVVGVLLVEPTIPSAAFVRRKLPLLSSMASEIATVILARRLEARMADADKMRMAGLLASGVAHNFNNLLQAVMGQASLIEMQLPEKSPLVEAAKTIVDAAGKGAALIKQMLSLTQQGMFLRESFSVNLLLQGSQDLYSSLLGSNVTLEYQLDENAPAIHADYGQIQQVITNLIVNAKEALGESEGARVVISSKQVRLSSGEVDRELSPGLYLRLDVADNGVGMSEERRSRCFEPFYTTKNVDGETGIGFDGSGLGLSLGYSILKQHDGLLVVRSAPGEGSVFSIYLRADEQKGEVEESALALEAEEVSSTGHLMKELSALIFEGAEKCPQIVEKTLHSFGFQSSIVSSREEFLESLKEASESLRLLIVDGDSFGKDLKPILSFLKERHRRVHCIFVVSKTNEAIEQLAEKSSLEVVEKPLGVWAIHAGVRKVLYGTSPNSIHAKVGIERSSDTIESEVRASEDEKEESTV